MEKELNNALPGKVDPKLALRDIHLINNLASSSPDKKENKMEQAKVSPHNGEEAPTTEETVKDEENFEGDCLYTITVSSRANVPSSLVPNHGQTAPQTLPDPSQG